MRFVPPRGYELHRELDRGSASRAAWVERDGHAYVCKRPVTPAEAAATAALDREAELLRAFEDPALPRLVERGNDDAGPYLVETLAPGASLGRAVREGYAGERRAPPGPRALHPRLVLAAGRALFATLARLGAIRDAEGPRGFVHGDIAPDHVFWVPGAATVTLVDLGAAGWRDAPSTARGAGTLPYAPPERVRGEAGASAAGDVYAAAATLLFSAIGRRPCHAEEEAARLLEIGERGIDPAFVTGTRLFDRPRHALRAALAFDAAARPSLAELVDAFGK